MIKAVDEACRALEASGDYGEFFADCFALGLDPHEIRQHADAIESERAKKCQKTSG